jgi:O-antigen ligase
LTEPRSARGGGPERRQETSRTMKSVGGHISAWLPAAAIVVGIALAMPAALLMGSKFGQLIFAGALALALGLCALFSPVFATIGLLTTLFLRLPLHSADLFPIELFWPALAVLVIATVLRMARNRIRLRGIGAVEWAMALYLMWNVYSMLATHKYPAGEVLVRSVPDEFAASVPRFIVIGTLIPFVMYMVGRYTFDRAAAVQAVLWTILTAAAFSAVMSILPTTGPTELVWPRYILEVPKLWVGRAVGVVNHPVANGMVLALGFAIAMLLLGQRSEPAWRRCVAFAVAVACGVGTYLTYTRAAWLSAVAVIVIGATLAKGFRQGFIVVLGLVMAMAVINWSVFTSSDREAGGVGSMNEVNARLNDNQTALWAAAREPFTGWGVGRFQSVNAYHHQQWSPEILWNSGYGDAPHENELGILAELGAIGLALWISVLGLIAYRLWNAYRTFPDDDRWGKPLTVLAIMAIAIFLCSGATVDLRFLEFPPAVIFLLAGITVGWSDRYKRAQAAAGGDFAEQLRPLHA